MKISMQFAYGVLFCLSLSQNIFANTDNIHDTLVVGQPFPSIILKNVKHYTQQQIRSKNLRGKWFILDFWSRGCSSCIEAFPTMNSLQIKYGQKLQVFLVGKNDSHIEAMYEKFRLKYSLVLPVLFDKSFFNKFRIHQVPYTIIVDSHGIIRAITSYLTEPDFSLILEGKTPLMHVALNRDQEKALDQTFDLEKLLYVDGNGGPDTSFLFRSVLGPWVPAMPTMGADFPYVHNNRIQVTGVSISDLYMSAYGDTLTNMPFRNPNSFGEFWLTPELKVKDTTVFFADYLKGKNLFCYSQSAPAGKTSYKLMRERMQRDLQNYFGYQVEIKTEIKPCWDLVKVGDSLYNFGPPDTAYIKDENDQYLGPLEYLTASMWYHNQGQGLFYNKTGLDGNLKISMDIIMSDISDLNKGLKKYGLTLQKGEHEVKVIVISDN